MKYIYIHVGNAFQKRGELQAANDSADFDDVTQAYRNSAVSHWVIVERSFHGNNDEIESCNYRFVLPFNCATDTDHNGKNVNVWEQQ